MDPSPNDSAASLSANHSTPLSQHPSDDFAHDSSSTAHHHPDQIMDMFLHQVTEYNTEQLSFDDRMAHASGTDSF
jgi:hypothetical protein